MYNIKTIFINIAYNYMYMYLKYAQICYVCTQSANCPLWGKAST